MVIDHDNSSKILINDLKWVTVFDGFFLMKMIWMNCMIYHPESLLSCIDPLRKNIWKLGKKRNFKICMQAKVDEWWGGGANDYRDI